MAEQLSPEALADLYEALDLVMDALLAFDGHVSEPCDEDGWTDPGAYAAYMQYLVNEYGYDRSTSYAVLKAWMDSFSHEIAPSDRARRFEQPA